MNSAEAAHFFLFSQTILFCYQLISSYQTSENDNLISRHMFAKCVLLSIPLLLFILPSYGSGRALQILKQSRETSRTRGTIKRSRLFSETSQRGMIHLLSTQHFTSTLQRNLPMGCFAGRSDRSLEAIHKEDPALARKKKKHRHFWPNANLFANSTT